MDDSFLDKMNNHIKGLDNELVINGESKHNIFIIGAPRSGTTLLSQLFSGCSNVGYPNNLMAAFWNAPVAGALLSERWTNKKIFTGNSNFGQTHDFREPHEFGAFWRSSLLMNNMHQPHEDLSQTIQWNELAKTLKDITRVFKVPVVYKAFHLIWFINEINKKLPDSKWIWIKRKTVNNARSILDLRRHLYNDINIMASLMPIGIEKFNENPFIEVVAQVELINQWIDSQLKKVVTKNKFTLNLESLVNDPVNIFNEIAFWSEVKVIDKNLESATQNIKPEIFENDEEYRKIEEAYMSFLNK